LASLGAAAVITLIGSVSTKVILEGAGNKLTSLGRNLDTVILPLLFVLSFIVSIKVWEILSGSSLFHVGNSIRSLPATR
jgi:hypothetical protein